MSILNRLKTLKQPSPFGGGVGRDNNHMHHTVLECNLVRLGCDFDVVSDALLEHPGAWEGIIKYFEEKNAKAK